MGIPGKDCEGTREILGEFGKPGAGHEHKKIKVSMVQCDVSIGRGGSKWHGASTGKEGRWHCVVQTKNAVWWMMWWGRSARKSKGLTILTCDLPHWLSH